MWNTFLWIIQALWIKKNIKLRIWVSTLLHILCIGAPATIIAYYISIKILKYYYALSL